MDDNEYDGLSRSSFYGQGYTSGGAYPAESFVPSGSANDRRPKEPFKSNLIKLRKDAPMQRNRARTSSPEIPDIIGSSDHANQLRDKIRLYAEDDSPVLISGETGVGKELVAQHLHALSSRRNEAFYPLNAGGMTETLAADELFGHAKGAYTGAIGEREGAFSMADGGVLFLDEIGDMPLSIQTQLLRVLEDGMVMKLGGKSPTRVDFRLISATNVDLGDEVRSGQFRRDLFYRINVLVIDVPPLRVRGDDVVEIAEMMVATHKNERYRDIKLSPNAADRLRAHAFPGNVRELDNVLTRALVHAQRDKILPEHICFDRLDSADHGASPASFNVDEAKNLISRLLMMKALHASEGNVTKAATLTGRSRGTLHSMIKSLEGEDFASAYQALCAEMKTLLNDC